MVSSTHKQTLYKNIAQETGVDKKDVVKVVKALEEQIMDVIASEDELSFLFGTIRGITKPPWRITGYYRVLSKPTKRNGWTVAKGGWPEIEWSKQAKYYTPIDAKEYFERPENKYTSKARLFRQENDIPEISEYADLPEEKVVELCKKADRLQKGEMGEFEEKSYYRHERLKEKTKQIKREKIIEEDMQRQRDEGVPEDQVVRRTFEEVMADREEKWREKQNPERYIVNDNKRDSHY